MGLTVSKRLLCSAIGMAVAGQGQAAAIQLDAFVDGQPAAVTEVLLNGESIGNSAVGGSFWYDEVSGGRHQLQVRIDGETISYEFSVSADEAAVITVNHASASGESTKSLQRINLARFDATKGDAVMIASGEREDQAPGLIQGAVVSKNNEAPIRNVTVKVIGAEAQTVTDRYGNFELELPPGVYELQLEHDEYRTGSLKALRVLPKMNLVVDVQLSTADVFAETPAGAIEEVQVMGRYLPGNPIEIERISTSVVDTIDFTQIARFDDSMVSSALKRVVGVTLEDDRYAVVRGMKSRYQSTDFNGATLPSTDPARRDLPLDIFPAGIMQGLSLQKSATADVPSSATAGHISMQTKDIPEEAFFKISYSATHGDMHGDDMLMSSTEGDRDWLGMDDGSRDLPDELALTLGKWLDIKQVNEVTNFDQEAIKRMGQSLEHNAIEYGEAPIDSSLSLSGGNSWDIAEQRLGFIGALRYSSKWSNNTKTNFNYSKNTGSDGSDIIVLDEVSETSDTNNVIDFSTMLNLEWAINDRHQLRLNNIALRHTTNSAEIETNYQVPSLYDRILGVEDLDAIKSEEGMRRLRNQRVDWIEEQLLSHQVWGTHSLALSSTGSGWSSYLGDLAIDWQLMDAGSEYDRPNATLYSYDADFGDTYAIDDDGDQYNLWEYMEEENRGYNLDLVLPIEDIYGVSLAVKVGSHKQLRDRDGYYYYYTIKGTSDLPDAVRENPDPREVYAPEYFVGAPGVDGTYLSVGNLIPGADVGFTGDSYIVEQDFQATYGLVEANIREKLKANIGVRKESFLLSAEQYAYTPEPLTDLLDTERTSPSLSLTYLFTDAWQLRAAWSETVSWPEIFEVVPRRFSNIETLERYIGNPNLKPADIENLDFRLEWYPSESESVTLALFSKDITNAIENRFDGSGDKFDYYTFDNAEAAEVYGVELDIRQEFVLGRDQGHELFVQFNYTDITSTVEVTEGVIRAKQIERPLQGQPEYIANLQLGYDHVDSGQEVTLVFNRKGEELAVANDGQSKTPSHVYRRPYSDLRVIYKKNFLNGLSLSASIDNLLDEEHALEYETYDTPYLLYTTGRKFKLKASYDF